MASIVPTSPASRGAPSRNRVSRSGGRMSSLRYHATMSVPSLRRPRSIAALAAVLALALAGCGERPRHAVVPAGATVVALGDSLTYGTGAESASSYPSVLAALTAWNVVNAGVPGETAAQGCDRLPGLIAEHRPALVLVLLGGNDFLRRRPDAGDQGCARRVCRVRPGRRHDARADARAAPGPVRALRRAALCRGEPHARRARWSTRGCRISSARARCARTRSTSTRQVTAPWRSASPRGFARKGCSGAEARR